MAAGRKKSRPGSAARKARTMVRDALEAAQDTVQARVGNAREQAGEKRLLAGAGDREGGFGEHRVRAEPLGERSRLGPGVEAGGRAAEHEAGRPERPAGRVAGRTASLGRRTSPPGRTGHERIADDRDVPLGI